MPYLGHGDIFKYPFIGIFDLSKGHIKMSKFRLSGERIWTFKTSKDLPIEDNYDMSLLANLLYLDEKKIIIRLTSFIWIKQS